MKKRRSLLLLAVFGISLGLVTACGGETPEPDPTPTPGPGEEIPEPPTPTPPEELTEEDYQKEMLGTFYSKEGTVTVTYEGLTFEGEETLNLTPTIAEELKEGNETRTAILYEDEAGKTYRIHFNFGVAQKLVLEVLEGTEYEVVTTLSPSIEEFTGAYTYSGDTDSYNYAFSITDTFDTRFDAFIVNYFSYDYYTTTYYYANSYFAEMNGELVKVFDLMDYEDEYWYTTYSEASPIILP